MNPSTPAPPRSLPAPDTVRLGGVPVATWVLGPEPEESAGDLVICHGTPWCAALWAELAVALSERWRVHLWDMPGYGRSSRDPSAALDLRAQASRLADLLAHWALERPHVLAHDIGGAVGLGAHLRHGAEFEALMLWDVVTLDPWGSPFFRLVAEHADVFAALPPALHGALVREYVRGAAARPLTTDALDALVTPWTGTSEERTSFYRQIASLHPDDTRDLAASLDRVRAPVSIGWGAEDPWIPADQARRLADALPGEVPVSILPGVGHLAPLEAPDELSGIVGRWLDATTVFNQRVDDRGGEA
jgi:pimeloyl-ACP methyl ester carboxylesterase